MRQEDEDVCRLWLFLAAFSLLLMGCSVLGDHSRAVAVVASPTADLTTTELPLSTPQPAAVGIGGVSQPDPWAVYIVPLIAFFGALVVAYFTNRWTLSRELSKATREQQLSAYRDLTGLKIVLQQLMVSRFEALIYSDYHEMKWHVSGALKDSLDYDEAVRWMRKSEDYVLKIIDTIQKLFEVIAIIDAVYPHDKDLDTMIKALYEYKTLSLSVRPDPTWSIDQIETWKVKASSQVQDLARSAYGEPIDQLRLKLRLAFSACSG